MGANQLRQEFKKVAFTRYDTTVLRIKTINANDYVRTIRNTFITFFDKIVGKVANQNNEIFAPAAIAA